MLKFPLQPVTLHVAPHMWLPFVLLCPGAEPQTGIVSCRCTKSEKHFAVPGVPPSQCLPLPPNEPAKVQLHFLNSTHRLSTIKPGINPREKMVLKSILMTPLPLLRGRLMPAQKISLQLVLFHDFCFNPFEFLRKGFHLEEKAVEIPNLLKNGSFRVIRTRGLDWRPAADVVGRDEPVIIPPRVAWSPPSVSSPPLSCLSQLKRSLPHKSPCISWNATGVSRDVIN